MKKQQNPNNTKISIAEYQARCAKQENNATSTLLLQVVASAICVVVLVAMFFLFKAVYEIDAYAGYAVGVVCIVAFVALFVVPICKVLYMRKFEVAVSASSLAKTKRHNAKVRQKLAERIVQLHTKTSNKERWYTDQRVQALMDSFHNKEQMRLALNDIYHTDIKKKGRDLIALSAVKSALLSGFSQSATLDTMVVGATNLQLVKDIVYLYGFRPSERKMVKIYTKVINASLVAYGISPVSTGVGKMVGSLTSTVPLLGTIVDSSIQGLTNAIFTIVIGNNTIKYLIEEYNLQNLIDNISVPTAEETLKLQEEVKRKLSTKKSPA